MPYGAWHYHSMIYLTDTTISCYYKENSLFLRSYNDRLNEQIKCLFELHLINSKFIIAIITINELFQNALILKNKILILIKNLLAHLIKTNIPCHEDQKDTGFRRAHRWIHTFDIIKIDIFVPLSGHWLSITAGPSSSWIYMDHEEQDLAITGPIQYRSKNSSLRSGWPEPLPPQEWIHDPEYNLK